MIVALWGREQLAEDSGVEDGSGWGGVTLAHNVRSPAEVDAVIEEAQEGPARGSRAKAPRRRGMATQAYSSIPTVTPGRSPTTHTGSSRPTARSSSRPDGRLLERDENGDKARVRCQWAQRLPDRGAEGLIRIGRTHGVAERG
jgi:hypothetical protein